MCVCLVLIVLLRSGLLIANQGHFLLNLKLYRFTNSSSRNFKFSIGLKIINRGKMAFMFYIF